MMRVAIVGAGLFGATAAIYLAREGHEVHLFDRSGGLLQAASGINQFRLHAGYHYPRSWQTIKECQDGLPSFVAEYGAAVSRDGYQFYAIAREGSKVSGLEFLDTLKSNGLPFKRHSEFINTKAIDVSVSVDENRIDPAKLRNDVRHKLQGVRIRLTEPAYADMRREFDKIIIAAYANVNKVADVLGCEKQELQFELCEKPVLRMPRDFHGTGIVIMDGPFCSVDPMGSSGLHVMGHVVHAIHATNVGYYPEFPRQYGEYLNQGIVDFRHTHVDRFIASGKRFIPMLEEAEYVGSMLTVRTVLPNMDKSDARPTLVTELDDQVIRIFSGKLGTAVTAAQRVCEMLATSRFGKDDLALSAA